MNGLYLALCQDCRRVEIFGTLTAQQDAHDGAKRCECGGDLCACEVCAKDAADDLAGY
jgi:hypothetical protein